MSGYPLFKSAKCCINCKHLGLLRQQPESKMIATSQIVALVHFKNTVKCLPLRLVPVVNWFGIRVATGPLYTAGICSTIKIVQKKT